VWRARPRACATCATAGCAAGGQKGVRIHTSFDPAMSCGIGNIQIEGIDSAALAKHLWERRASSWCDPAPEFQGLRVDREVYSTLAEVDAFADEMER